jgi:hypothetical protein
MKWLYYMNNLGCTPLISWNIHSRGNDYLAFFFFLKSKKRFGVREDYLAIFSMNKLCFPEKPTLSLFIYLFSNPNL